MEEQPPKTERHFLTDAVIYGVGSALSQAVSILLLPLYTRYLSPADFGVMEIIERIGNIMNICLMTGGVSQAAMAFYLQANDKADRERVAVSVAVMLSICFVLAGLVTIVVAPALSGWLELKNPKLLVFGALTVLTQLSLVLPLTMMQARVESIAYVSISIAMSVLRIGLAFLFVAYLGWGLLGVYWSMLITSVGFGVVLMGRELRRGSLSVDWQKCLAITRFSLPFIPTSMLGFLILNADRFFLLSTAGPAAVGIYSLGAKLAGAVAIVSTTPLFKVWSARMYAALEQPGGSHYGGRMLNQMLLTYSFVGVGLCLFHREVLTLLSGDEYAGAGSVIAPASIGQRVSVCEYVHGVRILRSAKDDPQATYRIPDFHFDDESLCPIDSQILHLRSSLRNADRICRCCLRHLYRCSTRVADRVRFRDDLQAWCDFGALLLAGSALGTRTLAVFGEAWTAGHLDRGRLVL